ncbi:DUF5786 family protein [Salinilacihabitans rarus]|uniref:DUF5786 family protein n=1 Tax=Salinilacihabitans rarus TaxID=2961596 RepID=UPI0020C92359|nr:DUF5786 family protein [Salinilacihabitans rarus]
MGFGSYDESEQRQPDADDDGESAGVTVHENDYEGEMSVETGGSTDDLLGQLQDIKASKDE